MMSEEEGYDYKLGYWQGVRDIWILLMSIGNSNASNIELNIRNLIEKVNQSNEVQSRSTDNEK